MAWNGFKQKDRGKLVKPVASFGVEKGYHDTTRWAETKFGRGPTGTAIRTGKPSVMRHIATERTFAPWWEEALKRGYNSSIALPLFNENGEVFGTLNIYCTVPDAFDKHEITLLNKLAENLSQGLRVLLKES